MTRTTASCLRILLQNDIICFQPLFATGAAAEPDSPGLVSGLVRLHGTPFRLVDAQQRHHQPEPPQDWK